MDSCSSFLWAERRRKNTRTTFSIQRKVFSLIDKIHLQKPRRNIWSHCICTLSLLPCSYVLHETTLTCLSYPFKTNIKKVARKKMYLTQRKRKAFLNFLNYAFSLITINTDLQTLMENKHTEREIKTKSSNSDTVYSCACRLKKTTFLARLDLNWTTPSSAI